jgi:hypothetical protein
LIDVDLLDLLRGAGDGHGKDETAEVRRKVKEAVKEGRSLRIECGIRVGEGEKKLLCVALPAGPPDRQN